MTQILVEDDPILKIVPVILDPDTPPEHKNAVADFFSHDEPDFPGWCRRLQSQIPGLYPVGVVLLRDEEDLKAKIGEADGIIVESLKVGRDVLGAARRLAIVQKFGTVIGNIDLDACKNREIEVSTLRRRVNISVAEQALALLMALARKVCELGGVVEETSLRKAGYNPSPYDRRYTGNSNFSRIPGLKTLYGSTLGIVGMGEIGREIASRAGAFGMRILYYQRNQIRASDEEAMSARYASLDEVLQQSDFVTIQLPLNASTRNILGPRELQRIKPGAILVNIARADLIDREALLAALDSGRLGGFGLDVGYSEPAKPDDPLLRYKKGNVILMPHTAVGARQNGLEDMEEMCLKLWHAIQRRSGAPLLQGS